MSSGKPAEGIIADKAQQKDADAGTKRNYDIEPCRKSCRNDFGLRELTFNRFLPGVWKEYQIWRIAA
jgi:hypothetical protein